MNYNKKLIKGRISIFLGEIKMLNPFYKFKKTLYKLEKDKIMELSKNTKISFNKLYWDYIISSYRIGCCYQEYSVLEFYNKTNKERKQYVRNRQNGILELKYNSKATLEDINDFEDKIRFNQVFKKYIKRKSIYSKDKKEIEKFIQGLDELVIKPLNLFGGVGIEVLKKEEINNIDEFVNKIIDGNYIIEECLKQCKEMSDLNPTSINTIRPFAIKTGDGKVRIIGCIIRIGKKGAKIDNISRGGLACGVDLDSGKIVTDGFDEFGNKFKYTETGKKLLGFQIPRWNEIKKVVEEAMNVRKNVRWASFDICIQEDSVEIIEGNTAPGAVTYQLDAPKLKILKQEYKGRR